MPNPIVLRRAGVVSFDYYVSKAGNDTTGNGTLTNPWLTIAKAISTIPAGKRVGIGPGTYAENTSSGRFNLTTTWAKETIFASTTGNPSDVVITGASDATYNTLITTGAQNWTFQNVTFGMRLSSNSHAMRIAAGSNIKFIGCTFLVSSAASVRFGLLFQPTGTATISNVTLQSCAFSQTGTNVATGIQSGYSAGSTITGISILNCTGTMYGESLILQYGTYTLTGGVFQTVGGSASHCLMCGEDNTTSSAATTVTASGVTVRASHGHGVLLGAGCTGTSFVNGYSDASGGGDYALVCKEHTGSSVTGNILIGGTAGAAYFKAATSCAVDSNSLTGASGGAMLRLAVGDTGHTSTTCSFQNNICNATGAGNLFDWATAGDGDNNTVDYNTYQLAGAGNFGTVRASSGIPDLAGLRLAWSGYTNPNNDANSTQV